MSASGFPGKREEANRAGMTATTSSGTPLSTENTVDGGGTTNNNTGHWTACYDLAQLHAVETVRDTRRRWWRGGGMDRRRGDLTADRVATAGQGRGVGRYLGRRAGRGSLSAPRAATTGCPPAS